LSGGLFMIDAGVAGLPEVPYQNREFQSARHCQSANG